MSEYSQWVLNHQPRIQSEIHFEGAYVPTSVVVKRLNELTEQLADKQEHIHTLERAHKALSGVGTDAKESL